MNRRERRAQGRQPGAIDVEFARAMELHKRGQLREALALYKKLLARNPREPNVLNLFGLLLHQSGDSEAGLAAIEKAIAIDANDAAYHSNRAIALRALGRLDEAAHSLARALALAPGLPELHNNLGNVQRDRGQLEAAIASYEGAIALRPDYAEAHNNLGACLRERGELEAAATAYRRALALTPAFPEALNNVGVVLTDRGELEAAIEALRGALALRPGYAEAHDNLGTALAAHGELERAVESFRRALALRPDYPAAHSNLLLFLNYLPAIDDASLFAEHRAWNAAHATNRARLALDPNRDPERKLRVGLVSPDLGQHPVGFFLEPLLRAHDRDRFAFVCFSDRAREDAFSARLKGHADEWLRCTGMTHEALARRVRDERIDVLIDLAGHTARNRLPMFAHKPAPVQASWLGYFHTTGLDAIDYLIMDEEHLPSASEAFISEAPLRLGCGRMCYAPPDYAPEPSPPPCLSRGFVTFGSFNNLTKVTPEVVALWARLLEREPRARLLLKWRTLDQPATRAALHAAFEAHGIARERIELRGHSPHAQMLAEYADVDIALDPFPFSGGLTSCEALWMGLPIVTGPSSRPVSRQSFSFLSRIGLAEYAVPNGDAYIEACLRLAHRDALAQLRSELRARVRASTLGDAARFARNFELALRTIWRRFCAGEPASALTVTA